MNGSMADVRERINRAISAAFCPLLRTTSRRTQGTLDAVDTLFLHVDALLLTGVRNSSTALTATLTTVAQLSAQLSPQPGGNLAATQLQHRRPQSGTLTA